MNYFIVFIAGLLLGSGIALFIWLKSKWDRDDLVKEKATTKLLRKENEILNKVLPANRRDKLTRFRELASPNE
jgi:hypothetical protein